MSGVIGLGHGVVGLDAKNEIERFAGLNGRKDDALSHKTVIMFFLRCTEFLDIPFQKARQFAPCRFG